MCKTPLINRVLKATFTPCRFKITFIWLTDNTVIWAKPILLLDDFIVCWVWTTTTWILAKIPLANINAFICG